MATTPRLPSVRTLIAVFGDRAKLARKVLEMPCAELFETLHGAARIAECYHTPSVSDVRLHVLDALAGTHGVEAFQVGNGTWCEYLNVGDPYVPTLTHFRGRYRVACWGDIVEREGAE
jgi:hypothetical protein